MDLRKLKKLIDLVEASAISELEVTEGEESVRIVKTHPPSSVVSATPITDAVSALRAEVLPVTASVQELTAPASSPITTSSGEPAVPEGHVVKSPMVGTFYTASSQTADPYVTIGQRVAVGDTLCIIEAMKLLNEIEADQAGEINAILVEDRQPVEYNEPVFIIG